jgi:hypothetical protein
MLHYIHNKPFHQSQGREKGDRVEFQAAQVPVHVLDHERKSVARVSLKGKHKPKRLPVNKSSSDKDKTIQLLVAECHTGLTRHFCCCSNKALVE